MVFALKAMNYNKILAKILQNLLFLGKKATELYYFFSN